MVDFGSKSKRMEQGKRVVVVGEIVRREWGEEWVSRIFSYDEFIITRAATGAKRK
jgi:hypothetical protein